MSITVVESDKSSFDIMSDYLKASNVSNYDFPTKTINESLKDVDARNPSKLTYEQKIDIKKECVYNPMYFFREILNIPYMLHNEYRHFHIAKNTSAKIYLELYAKKSVIDLDPRQTLKTTTSLAIILYKFIFFSQQDIKIIVKNVEIGIRDIEILNNMIDAIPNYILTKDKKLIARTQLSITNNINDNKISIHAIRIKDFDDNAYIDTIYKYYSNFFIGFSATHVLVDDLAFYSCYNVIHKILEIYIHGKAIIDVTSNSCEDSIFLEKYWRCGLHWDESMYDSIPENDTIVLHYEPEELMLWSKIYELYKMLVIHEDSEEELKCFRRELCIRPFDEDFDLKDYISKFKNNM